jgi:diadenosine tetraphosphate (Ap4A) HIT family hydrolase
MTFMANLIEERVELARNGKNPYLISRLKSGWVVIGDVQPLEGYCLLLADPVVKDLNFLSEPERTQYCLDMIRVGDALMKVTESYRINYETLGNSEPALHTHIFPRYLTEPDEKRRWPAFVKYDWNAARPFDTTRDRTFIEKMREYLAPYSFG